MESMTDVGLTDFIGLDNFYSTIGLAVAGCSHR